MHGARGDAVLVLELYPVFSKGHGSVYVRENAARSRQVVSGAQRFYVELLTVWVIYVVGLILLIRRQSSRRVGRKRKRTESTPVPQKKARTSGSPVMEDPTSSNAMASLTCVSSPELVRFEPVDISAARAYEPSSPSALGSLRSPVRAFSSVSSSPKFLEESPRVDSMGSYGELSDWETRMFDLGGLCGTQDSDGNESPEQEVDTRAFGLAKCGGIFRGFSQEMLIFV